MSQQNLILFLSFFLFSDRFEMNLNADQAAQSAQYAGRAMNMFQTAVNIDDQQPKAEGTTFWFRWLIRIIAVVTGIRKSSRFSRVFFIKQSIVI